MRTEKIAAMMAARDTTCWVSDGADEPATAGAGETTADVAATQEAPTDEVDAPAPKAERKPRGAKLSADEADVPHGCARLQCKGATGASVDGVNYDADGDGVVVVPLSAVSALLSHGFAILG